MFKNVIFITTGMKTTSKTSAATARRHAHTLRLMAENGGTVAEEVFNGIESPTSDTVISPKPNENTSENLLVSKPAVSHSSSKPAKLYIPSKPAVHSNSSKSNA
eukprot:724530_1